MCHPGFAAPVDSTSKPLPNKGRVTLSIPKPPPPGEPLVIQVTVGELPRRARIEVRSAKGELIGSISPFGQGANRTGGAYTIPVPLELVINQKLPLWFIVQEDKAESSRIPTDAEVKDVKVNGER